MTFSKEFLDSKHFRGSLEEARSNTLKQTKILIQNLFSVDHVEIRLGEAIGPILQENSAFCYAKVLGSQQELLGIIAVLGEPRSGKSHDQEILNGVASLLGTQLSAIDLSVCFSDDYDSLNKEIELIHVELGLAYDDLSLAQQELSDSYNLGVLLGRNLSRLRGELKAFLDQAPIAFGVVRHRHLKIELANKLILAVWGKDSSIVGKPLSVALPELIGQPYLDILDQVYTSGVRYVGKEASVMLEFKNGIEEVFFNFIYEPLVNARGNTSAIMIIATDVTQQTKNRMALEQDNIALKTQR